MSDPGGWPDAARPGVPMRPETASAAWFADPRRHLSEGEGPFVLLWAPADRLWHGARECYAPEDVAAFATYLGPCLLPAEVAAREAAARRKGIEEAAKEVDCSCEVRDAVLERLEAQGHKQASYLCRRGDLCCALQAAEIRTLTWEGER